MELKPKTENGKILVRVLENWLDSSQKNSLDKLKRVMYLYASRITKQDSFLAALYGQNVLNEPPSPDLMENLSTVVSRVQQAVEISVNKGCFKEIIVALEWSENGDILNEILKWAEGLEAKNAIEGINSIDLAPQRAERTLKSLFARSTPEIPKPREREINWAGGSKKVTALEICQKKIIVGWTSGQIKIFDVAHLDVIAGFQHFGSAICFQCTCKELISGHSDGNICVWNIESRLLMQKFLVEDSNSSSYPVCMRWRQPILLVATNSNKLKMWQYVSSSFTSLGEHYSYTSKSYSQYTTRVEFDQDYVVCLVGSYLRVLYLNGIEAREQKLASTARDIALQNGRLFIGCENKVMYIVDIHSGNCLKDLVGHADGIISMDVNDHYLVSGDKSGHIMLWDLTAVVDGHSFAGITIKNPEFPYSGPHGILRLGRTFIVRYDRQSQRIVVMEFTY